MSITTMTVHQLVALLKHLRGGTIGFDPFRDERTKTKASLLQFILSEYGDAAIVEAIKAIGHDAPTEPEATPVTPPPMPRVTAPVVAAAPNDAALQIGALLAQLAGKASVDETAVKGMIDAALAERDASLEALVAAAVKKLDRPVRVEIKTPTDTEYRSVGIQHKAFPDLLKACSAVGADGYRLNVWLAGPAGTGKTTAAKNAAAALGLPFHFNGAIDTKYEITGFIDAAGKYHRTPFREAYENGGVYLFDELDASSKNAVMAFNAALANGVATFPDGLIKRHKDCIILAGANTTGKGATTDYSAREKHDDSFLDRFVVLEWELDADLEKSLALDADWLDTVRSARERVKERGIRGHMITPRATVYGQALLAAGISKAKVAEMVLRKGLPTDTWKGIQ